MLEPGDKIDLHYPASTLVTRNPEWELRQFLIKKTRDVIEDPLDPESYFRRPMKRRSRSLLDAIDMETGHPRKIYLGSTREYWADGDLRVALYEPESVKPFRIITRGFTSTHRDRVELARTLKAVLELELDDLLVRVISDDLKRVG